jgi:hypothetical protein
MTTIKTLTVQQLRKLSTEAHLHGDYDTMRDCNTLVAEYESDRCLDLDDAIERYPEQAARVVKVIRDAEAQA